MAAFLTTPAAAGRDDYSHLLSSPVQQPWSLFASPAPAVQDGRLSFDVLTSPGAVAGGSSFKVHSASPLALFTAPDRSRAAGAAQQQEELQATLTQQVASKVAEAKQQEVAELVAGVAAKYGLQADYGKAEDTIKAVWAEQSPRPARARSPVAASPAAEAKQAAEEPTLGKNSSDHASSDEEAGQQATSTLKAASQAAPLEAGYSLKRPRLDNQGSFSFPAAAQPNAAAAAAGDHAVAVKRRRVQYDRMRELEAQVQRVRHVGDALGQSVRQAEAQRSAVTLENEQLWNALLHIHASLRAAHAAQLRHQVAMHAAAVAAALPLPAPPADVHPSPNALFGGLYSPDGDELAAVCDMFLSPSKPIAATAPANKPRKLFLEDIGRPAAPPCGELPPGLSPALWVQAA